jgi:hypothetical protein
MLRYHNNHDPAAAKQAARKPHRAIPDIAGLFLKSAPFFDEL